MGFESVVRAFDCKQRNKGEQKLAALQLANGPVHAQENSEIVVTGTAL
jgi:hypothetical protein